MTTQSPARSPLPTPVQGSRWLPRIASLLLTVSLPVVLILGSVRLMMTDIYLSLEYNKPDFPADSYGFTLADRLHYAPLVLHFMFTNDNISYLGDLKQPDGTPLFNDRELRHLLDVRSALDIAFLVLSGVMLEILIVLALLSRSPEGQRALRQGLFGGGLLMLAILGALLVYVLLNWDTFFDQFHELLFSGDSWVFAYSDSLIRLFPVRFWQDAALTIGGLSALAALLLIVDAWWSGRRANFDRQNTGS